MQMIERHQLHKTLVPPYPLVTGLPINRNCQ